VLAKRTPDGKRGLWVPSILERAQICERMDWKLLPEDLLECDIELRSALEALTIYEAMQQRSRDLKKMTPGQMKIADYVDLLRDELE
jgi:hypothetical protein